MNFIYFVRVTKVASSWQFKILINIVIAKPRISTRVFQCNFEASF